MSCSKPLPPFVCDSLYYLNRDQLERFSIVCRLLKNFIDRYFSSKPYRVFDVLRILGGKNALIHNYVQWYPNRGDYTAQQFLAGQTCSIDISHVYEYFSFTEMRSYLGPTVRIKSTLITSAGSTTYNLEHVAEMESMTYLWRDHDIVLRNDDEFGERIVTQDFQLILNSPTILQCQNLLMVNAHFSSKDYTVLYSVKVIKIFQYDKHEIDLWQQNWQQFLEQPRVKPLVVFCCLRREKVDNFVDQLSKAFSSAVSPNAFKIVFDLDNESLTEFRETNSTSREKLELKKGFPVEYQNAPSEIGISYTLERFSI